MYLDWEIDSAGIRGKQNGRFAQIVAATGISFQGKNNVMKLEDENDSTQFDVVSLEPNGNISLLGAAGWVEFPIATKGTLSLVKIDTVPNGDIFKHEYSYKYLGSEDILIAGYQFHTVKIDVQQHSWTNNIPDKPAGLWTTTEWFAKELNSYIRISNRPGAEFESGDELELDSCILK